MVTIQPFCGIIPNPIHAKDVAALPYDVMNYEEAKSITSQNPKSFLRVEKSEVDFGPDQSSISEVVLKKAAENLNSMLKSNLLIEDKAPYYYLYQQQMGNHIQTGLVCCSSVEDYSKNIIKKHEFTRKDKEDERTFHVHTVSANTGPVFLTYPHQAEMDMLVEKLTKATHFINFVSEDQVRHTLWKVEDINSIQKITEMFQKIPATYIADGHHRAAAAHRVQEIRKKENSNHTGKEEYNFFLTVIFPDNQMQIMDYNRVIKDLNGLSEVEFIQKLEAKFSIRKISISNVEDAKPKKHTQFSMYLGNNWYVLDIDPKLIPNHPVNSLDAALLQNEVLSPILGIEDPRTSKRIDFVGGIRGMKELVKRCQTDCVLAFALYPVSMSQLIAVADSGNVMPPKSTWFEPKLRSGMIVHRIS